MKLPKYCFLILGTLICSISLFAADTPLNLLQTGEFKPVKMHGKTTAAYGWFLIDWPRFFHIREKSYVPGDECFTFECEDNAAVFRYPDPLHPIHANSKRSVLFASRTGWPAPPAPAYRAVGRYMFNKGKLYIGGHSMKPSNEWKQFDFTGKHPFNGISLYPAAGSTFKVADLGCYAVYPEIGGNIPLPNGGKLTKILIKKDAHYLVRWGTALWRGWLWKLTGTALPVEISDSPVPGSLFIDIDPSLKRGWHLQVNQDGIRLTVCDEFAITSALFDYLRRSLGCAFYARDCQKIPAQGSVKTLPAANFRIVPKYGTITGDNSMHCLNGGRHLPLFSSINDVDYYHLANPQNDHVFNVILPMDMYLKKHPEYFMMDKHGRRVGHRDPCRSNPCFSNPEAMKLMLKNLLDYAKNQSVAKILTFETGDASTHCLCPDCIKMNGGTTSNTESQFDFANRFAPLLAKERPDMKLVRMAYASRHTLPRKNPPKYDNIIYCYCAGEELVPCTLHADCAINQSGLKKIREWSNMAKTPDRLGFMTYSDIRPLQFTKRMEHYSKYGNAYLYMFQWRGYSPAVTFVINRWNLGENALEALKEFDYYYYGKGGKYIHEINLLVEKFGSSYKHTSDELKQNKQASYHLGIWCGNEQVQTRLDRKTLDRIYQLFDQALAAVGNDKVYRQRIIYEKSLYLIEDLVRWNRSTCKTKTELETFAKRLAEYIRMAREFPAMFNKIFVAPTPRELMQNITGITIPTTVPFWANEPIFTKLLKAPEKMFRAGAEIFPGGWYFTAYSMDGISQPERFSDRCPPRYARVLNKKVSAEFSLAKKPAAPIILSIEALAEKTGNQSVKILINQKVFYRGKSVFPTKEWGRMGFSIPASFLNAGENTITIQPGNTASESMRISEIAILDPSVDFENFAQGKKETMWARPRMKKGNSITAANGKVTFVNSAKGQLQLLFFRHHNLPKTGIVPGARIKLTIRASGRGNMQLGFSGYYAYQRRANGVQKIREVGYQTGLYSRHYRSRHLRLTPEFKEYTEIIPCEKSTGMIFPIIILDGPGKAEVTAFKMEILEPEKTKKK